MTTRIEPAADQESVWDYPRPPSMASDVREVIVRIGAHEIARSRRQNYRFSLLTIDLDEPSRRAASVKLFASATRAKTAMPKRFFMRSIEDVSRPLARGANGTRPRP